MSKALVDSLNMNFASLLTSSLGFTAALAWNDAIKSLFVPGGAFEDVGAMGVWVTAALVTCIAFFATVAFTRAFPSAAIPQKTNPIVVKD